MMSPDQTILFTITTESTNEMLQLHLGQNLTPISIGDLLDRFPKLTTAKLAEMFQTFIREEKHIPRYPPPYVATIFSPFGQDIVAMISSVLVYTTNEYIDEIVLAFMSIYTPRQAPVVIYDDAKFIAHRMHDQFLRMSNEYSNTPLFCTTFFYISSQISFHSPCRSLIQKVNLDQ